VWANEFISCLSSILDALILQNIFLKKTLADNLQIKQISVLNTSRLFVIERPPWNKKLIGRTKLIFPTSNSVQKFPVAGCQNQAELDSSPTNFCQLSQNSRVAPTTMNGYICSRHVYNSQREWEGEKENLATDRDGQYDNVSINRTTKDNNNSLCRNNKSINNNPLKMEMKKDLLSVDRRHRNAHVRKDGRLGVGLRPSGGGRCQKSWLSKD